MNFKHKFINIRQRFKSNSRARGKFFVVDSLEELCHFFGFKNNLKIIEEDLDEVRFIDDVNNRRRRDAEVLSLISANVPAGRMLDIGTHLGRSAARMAVNSPDSTVYTVNIHPDEFSEGGILKTEQLSVDEIGSFYRTKNLKNVKQIYANTINWKVPDEINELSLVYIDGCHDKEVVYSDTALIIDRVIEGGYILWHDCSPIYRQNFGWINDSMTGIEWLLKDKIITGHVLNVRNSWIGIWKKM